MVLARRVRLSVIPDVLIRLPASAAVMNVFVGTLTVLVPYTRGDLVQLAHERGQILSERHTESGTQLVVRMPAESAHELAPFACDASHSTSATE